MPIQRSGLWGAGGFPSQAASWFQARPWVVGYRLKFNWRDLETNMDVWNWTQFDSQVNTCISAGLSVGLQIWVSASGQGTVDGQYSPSYLNTVLGLPLNSIGDGDAIYDLMDPVYYARFKNMIDQVQAHIYSRRATWQNNFVRWFSSEGSTGDEGPYHGTAIGWPGIGDDEWRAHKREIWSYMYTKFNSGATATPWLRVALNPSNSGENYEWALNNIPHVHLKAGDFSHNYNFPGEGPYGKRVQSLRDDDLLDHRTFGEFIAPSIIREWYDKSPDRHYFNMVLSSLTAGVDSLDVTEGEINNPTTPYPWLFMNRYGGQRTCQGYSFIGFRDGVDFADTTRFPEAAPYGNIVTSSGQNQIDNINSSTTLTQTEKENNISRTIVNNLASTRISSIRAAVPGAAYQAIDPQRNGNPYDYDFIVQSMLNSYDGVTPIAYSPNYGLWMHQYSPHTTSVGDWRVGGTGTATNQIVGPHGRFTRRFNNTNEMFFTLDAGMQSSGDDRIRITVTYYDEGTSIWSINVYTCKGKVEAKVTRNQNTLTWRTATTTISKCLLGGLMLHSSDITLKHISGTVRTAFSIMEVQNLTITG